VGMNKLKGIAIVIVICAIVFLGNELLASNSRFQTLPTNSTIITAPVDSTQAPVPPPPNTTHTPTKPPPPPPNNTTKPPPPPPLTNNTTKPSNKNVTIIKVFPLGTLQKYVLCRNTVLGNRVISFGLYGTHDRYTKGALKNVELAKVLFNLYLNN
jgi:type IV secretory pathway VirB10-like protein